MSLYTKIEETSEEEFEALQEACRKQADRNGSVLLNILGNAPKAAFLEAIELLEKEANPYKEYSLNNVVEEANETLDMKDHLEKIRHAAKEGWDEVVLQFDHDTMNDRHRDIIRSLGYEIFYERALTGYVVKGWPVAR